MSVKALGIALKLTFQGTNQLIYPQTWFFALVVATCILTQMNYLNKVIIIKTWQLDKSLHYHQQGVLFRIDRYGEEIVKYSLVYAIQALDTFNTAVVSPIYYVMFTTLTILASVIMFKVSEALPYINLKIVEEIYIMLLYEMVELWHRIGIGKTLHKF